VCVWSSGFVAQFCLAMLICCPVLSVAFCDAQTPFRPSSTRHCLPRWAAYFEGFSCCGHHVYALETRNRNTPLRSWVLFLTALSPDKLQWLSVSSALRPAFVPAAWRQCKRTLMFEMHPMHQKWCFWPIVPCVSPGVPGWRFEAVTSLPWPCCISIRPLLQAGVPTHEEQSWSRF
jgi:hypothetical protein